MAKNQLKSINYQLSNLKYVHDGWTVRLPSPFELDEIQPVQNKDISLQATVIPSAQIRTLERRMTVKYFRNGNISFILFPNGTGNVYYENGRLAIIISQVSLGMHIYIVLSNDSCQQIIAVFDPYGNACCNFGTGKLRIQISPFGGYEINQENDDAQVIRRKRWLWWDFKDHVHAPPFQPFLFSLNENICVKIHSQENIYLSYRCEIHQLSFRVGSRLKINKPESLAELQPFDSNEAFLKKRKNRIEQLINLIKDSTKKNNQGSVKQITVLKNKIQSRLDSEILPKAKTGILKDARNVNISQMSTHRKDASKLSKFLIVP